MRRDEEMRINKYISHNTKYSRREADELIKSGKVKVDGKVVNDLSTKVTRESRVMLFNKTIKEKDMFTVFVYNKPKGELVTKKDDRGRKTIYDTLGRKYAHFLSIGRLDFASEGLLLLTDSPKVATALMQSSLERIYQLKIKGLVTESMQNAMKKGISIKYAKEGGHEKSKIESMEFAPFLGFKILNSSEKYSKLRVAIGEGKNRELRRFFAHFNSEVMDLKRLEFGGISLDTLPIGKSRFLTKSEYDSLHNFLKELKKNGSIL